jgi:imidazole glycerol-phosphate synthase subunit HisF
VKFRIIPIVLYDGTTVVKGRNFVNDRTIGSVEAVANLYARRRPDEIFFIDISATLSNREPNFLIFEKFAEKFDIPFCVGGGINDLSIAQRCLASGAEKVLLGTAAHKRIELVSEIAEELGSQAVVVSVDTRDSDRIVYVENGRVRTNRNLFDFVRALENAGAGEILLQDISRDGMRQGLNTHLIGEILAQTSLPIVASGGAGISSHFAEAAKIGVSGVAAGSIFQFTETTPAEVASYLNLEGIDVRLSSRSPVE